MSDLLTPREFAEFAGIRFDRLYILWAQGRGPERVRQGKHVYISREMKQSAGSASRRCFRRKPRETRKQLDDR
jgi:hypothetical protein